MFVIIRRLGIILGIPHPPLQGKALSAPSMDVTYCGMTDELPNASPLGLEAKAIFM